jgi:hypothetical protein
METEDEKRLYDATRAAADGFYAAGERDGRSYDQVQKAAEAAEKNIGKGLPLCESQIERMMLPWLVYLDYKDGVTYPAHVHIPSKETVLPWPGIVIVPQFAIAKYRLDFAVICRHKGSTRIVAVECDGAKFHDVTKDRIRDNYLASWNIPTFRSRGSDINKGPQWAAGMVALALSEWRATL